MKNVFLTFAQSEILSDFGVRQLVCGIQWPHECSHQKLVCDWVPTGGHTGTQTEWHTHRQRETCKRLFFGSCIDFRTLFCRVCCESFSQCSLISDSDMYRLILTPPVETNLQLLQRWAIISYFSLFWPSVKTKTKILCCTVSTVTTYKAHVEHARYFMHWYPTIAFYKWVHVESSNIDVSPWHPRLDLSFSASISILEIWNLLSSKPTECACNWTKLTYVCDHL